VTRRPGWLVAVSLACGASGLAARALQGQDTALVADSGFVEVDRIVAIVGDVAIPFSRVEEHINMRRARGQPVPSDSGQLRALWREIVESMVDEELVVQEAQRDTAIVIDDAELQRAVDETVRQVRQQFRSELEYERQLRASGFGSLEEYRRWITDQRRREMLQEALMRRLREMDALKPIQPTQAEINQYYQRVIAEQPGERPASISFRQIVIRPRPDSAALLAAFRLADSLARELRAGADFAVLARRFSQDPGSREQGGELGWFRRGRMVREFEDVAFALRPGYVSNPVRTVYGFHVIQVQRAEPAEVQARHILITPEITDANVAEARARGDSVVAALARGAPFDSLHRLLHDPSEESFAQDVPRDSLPPEYRTALEGRKPGEVVGPIELERSEGRVRYAVVWFESERAAGPLSLEEVRDRIRANLAQDNALQRYLRTLRRRTYVEIRL
jgi:peptidyl-prolyl cis-trans isomerase SurA